ncbi:MAG TPA: pseudouridine synthase [Patescibacteria group bacterium]|nr:pseudouridine synthase [Patescibacteria group bacterium]
MEKIRVQKFISEAGVASRRQAEEFIRSGQVFINGKKAKLGDKVNPSTDTVKVYGKIIPRGTQKYYVALYKPKNTMVTKRDPYGRKTIFSLLPPDIQKQVWNIGRLDYETEGLLLLTNDGDVTQKLAHPSFEHEKEYEVKVDPEPTPEQLEDLRAGVKISQGHASATRVKAVGTLIYITLKEGKKRQVRRMIDAVGLSVINLKRVRIGKLNLKDLALEPGEYSLLKKSDIL